jgi:hypothetical protein
MVKFFTFIEMKVFTKRIVKMVDDETYADLQAELVKDPTKGKVSQGAGGLRKIRMAARGKGKRGGARVIYYLVLIDDRYDFCLRQRCGRRPDCGSKETLKALTQTIAEQHRRK